ncbi:MAG: DNA-directed RNA polymerase subunit beta, partial [Flavobacteriia bacterium]|nr:DNA-directed RNA polymerase subunit beta [Candidatus Bostrichicola ureolyticus]
MKDVSLRADPSLFGVVIDTKLFYRNNRKDKKSKDKEKSEIERLDAEYKNTFLKLREQIIEKLFSLLDGEISKGIFFNSKKVIAKGVKFTLKLLNNIKDYSDISEILCTSNEKNNLISKLLHNFKKTLTSIKNKFKRKKIYVTIGDELPTFSLRFFAIYTFAIFTIPVGN